MDSREIMILSDFSNCSKGFDNLAEYLKEFKTTLKQKVSFQDLKDFEYDYCAEYEIDDNCEECDYYHKGCVNKLIDDNFTITKLIK